MAVELSDRFGALESGGPGRGATRCVEPARGVEALTEASFDVGQAHDANATPEDPLQGSESRAAASLLPSGLHSVRFSWLARLDSNQD